MRIRMTRELLGLILLLQGFHKLQLKLTVFNDADPMESTRDLFASLPKQRIPDNIKQDDHTSG